MIMVQVNVNVWWSAGRGDGDSYDTEYEFTDEQYALFRKCLRDGSTPEEKEEIAGIWEKIEEELIAELKENSLEYEEENYRDECLIDPDSDEYDPDGDEEQFTMDIEEWWDEQYTAGADLLDFEANEYEFNITLASGKETSFKFNLYEDEAEKLQDLQDDGSTLDELKDDSAYDYIYEELLAEIKNNLQEDFDSEEDDTDIQFEIE